jgi:hypothetical protein
MAGFAIGVSELRLRMETKLLEVVAVGLHRHISGSYDMRVSDPAVAAR